MKETEIRYYKKAFGIYKGIWYVALTTTALKQWFYPLKYK